MAKRGKHALGTRQRLTVLGGVVLALAMLLYPPWKARLVEGVLETETTYAFIGDRPFPGAEVDLQTLAIQWAVVAVATLACVVLFRD